MSRPIDPSDRDPHPIGDSLDRVAGRLGIGTSRHLSQLFTRWEESVGAVVASHARPLGLRDGVLHVAVDHPGWATQLRHLEPDFVARLAEVLGPGVVTSIRVRVEADGQTD